MKRRLCLVCVTFCTAASWLLFSIQASPYFHAPLLEWLSPHLTSSSFPPCQLGRHFPGKWEEIPDNDPYRVELDWPCCGWDNAHWGKHPECGNATAVGAEKALNSAFVPKEDYAKVGGNGCACNEKNLISARWVPDDCRLWRWKKKSFCQLLGRRKIMFIGDSTMQQTAAVVMNAVYGDCHRSIAFGMSDTLMGRSLGAMNRGRPWSDWVKEFNPDIAVLSTGAHIKTADFRALLQEIYSNFSRFPETRFIWKTQNPGGCDSKMQVDFKDNFWTNYSGHGDAKRFGWDQFMDRDITAIDFFQRTPVSILDVRPLYFRTDAHPGSYPDTASVIDCLHFCCHSRGPLHLIPILLRHTLADL